MVLIKVHFKQLTTMAKGIPLMEMKNDLRGGDGREIAHVNGRTKHCI